MALTIVSLPSDTIGLLLPIFTPSTLITASQPAMARLTYARSNTSPCMNCSFGSEPLMLLLERSHATTEMPC